MYTLKEISDVFDSFQKWLAMVERQFEVNLQKLKCDNGGEYVSQAIQSFLTAHGITSRQSVPQNQHHNGVAERLK